MHKEDRAILDVYPANQFLTKLQRQFNGGRIVFSKHGAGAIGYPQAKMKLNLSLTNYRKINSKGVIDLNVKDNSIKLLEEYIGENLQDFKDLEKCSQT